MTEVPIWVICGGKDRLVVNVELGVGQVQKYGGILRYTLLPHNGHGGGRDRVEPGEIRDWLYLHQLPEKQRKAVDLYQFYGLDVNGIGKVQLKSVEPGRELRRIDDSMKSFEALPSWRSMMRMAYGLQKPARQSGRLMSQPLQIHRSSEGVFSWCMPTSARIDPSILPEGTSDHLTKGYRCLSLYAHVETLNSEMMRKLLKEVAEKKALELTGDERLILHSLRSITGNRYFVELQLIVE